MNKEKTINLRISYSEFQKIRNEAVKLRCYFKPSGGINISKYVRHCVLNIDDKTIQLDGMDKVIELKYQVQKLGNNFNQLLNLIHTERKMNQLNGEENDAVINKYNYLDLQYDDLRSINIEALNCLAHIENQLSRYR